MRREVEIRRQFVATFAALVVTAGIVGLHWLAGRRTARAAPQIQERAAVRELKELGAEVFTDVRVAGGATAGWLPPLLEERLIHPMYCVDITRVSLTTSEFRRLGPLLGRLPYLRHVCLNGARLTDADLELLAPHLSWPVGLELNGTNVTDAGVAALSRTCAVSGLHLAGTSVTDRGMAQLRTLTGLRTLGLARTRVGDACIQYLGGMEHLRMLDLSATAVSDDGIEHLATLRRLETLVLRGTAVGDRAMSVIARMPSLRVLDVSGTQITDVGLGRLATCDLRQLELSQTGITDASVDVLGCLPELRYVGIVETKITQAGRAVLIRLSPTVQIDTQPEPQLSECWGLD